MITVPNAFADALKAPATRPRWLVDIGADDSETGKPLIQITTHQRDLTIGDDTWRATGYLTKIPTIKRTRELKAHSISLELNALDAGLRDSFLSSTAAGQPLKLHLCLLDKAGDVIAGHKVTQYKGLIDAVSLAGGKTLSLAVQSPFAKPSQTGGRLITNAAQLEAFPGDLFMNMAHQRFENLEWGGKVD